MNGKGSTRRPDDIERALRFCLDTFRRVEWGSYDDGACVCPECGGMRTYGKHSQECHLEAAIEIAAEALNERQG